MFFRGVQTTNQISNVPFSSFFSKHVHETSPGWELLSQEEHYVCRHENCRREAYRLVAFANEDDLWMHEIKEWHGPSLGWSFFVIAGGCQLNVWNIVWFDLDSYIYRYHHSSYRLCIYAYIDTFYHVWLQKFWFLLRNKLSHRVADRNMKPGRSTPPSCPKKHQKEARRLRERLGAMVCRGSIHIPHKKRRSLLELHIQFPNCCTWYMIEGQKQHMFFALITCLLLDERHPVVRICRYFPVI